MHSSASRAIDGTNSVKRVCEEANLVFISQARNEPNASAANSGTVIMDRCGASGISDDSVPTAASRFVLLKSQVECGRSLGSMPPYRVAETTARLWKAPALGQTADPEGAGGCPVRSRHPDHVWFDSNETDDARMDMKPQPESSTPEVLAGLVERGSPTTTRRTAFAFFGPR